MRLIQPTAVREVQCSILLQHYASHLRQVQK